MKQTLIKLEATISKHEEELFTWYHDNCKRHVNTSIKEDKSLFNIIDDSKNLVVNLKRIPNLNIWVYIYYKGLIIYKLSKKTIYSMIKITLGNRIKKKKKNWLVIQTVVN